MKTQANQSQVVTAGQDSPLVSIVIPCRNEKAHIERCVKALLANTVQDVEVIVVDGCSEDGTAEAVAGLGREDPRVKLLSNPARVTPAALNMGVRATRSRYCAILGAHSEPAQDWVHQSLEALRRHPEAAATGGVLETVGETFVGRVIGAALSSPFGVGNARFRVGGRAGHCDTVVFGCYRREVFDRHGYFDEALTTNQDDDFNIRLCAAGEKLYFEPAIRCRYYSRSTWRKALSQYWRYGFFKVRVFRNNRRIGSVRQLAPAAWVGFLGSVPVVSAVLPGYGMLAAAIAALYTALGLGYAVRSAAAIGAGAFLFFPVAASIHLAYGLGTWCGMLMPGEKR